MRAWLAKFRISAALDARKSLAPALRESIEHSEELRRFELEARAVDRALKQAPPRVPSPPDLHGSIMHALRDVRPALPERRPSRLSWLPAPALAAFLLIAGWWALRITPNSLPLGPGETADALHPAASALELGERATRQVPLDAVAPLAQEWDRLSGDLDRAREFVLASLP